MLLLSPSCLSTKVLRPSAGSIGTYDVVRICTSIISITNATALHML